MSRAISSTQASSTTLCALQVHIKFAISDVRKHWPLSFTTLMVKKLNLINKMSLFRNCYFMKQVAINRSCCQCLLYSVIHKFRNKAERMFSDSSVFPAKFLDISRFWGHPEVSHFRKIKLGNSSLMCPLCSMTMIGQNIVTNWQSYNKIITSEMDMGWVQPWVGCVEKSVLIFYIFR